MKRPASNISSPKRESEGIVCSKCGCNSHYWKSYRNQWQCKECGHRTGLRTNTVMHSSKLPLMTWFLAIHLITSTKKSFFHIRITKTIGYILLSDSMGDDAQDKGCYGKEGQSI